MHRRVVLILVLAGVLGFAASVLVWRYANLARPVELEASEPPPTVEIVAAKTNLPIGTLIAGEHVKLVPVTSGHVPPGHFRETSQVVGRAVVVPVVANEAVLEPKLAPEGSGAGLPAVIPQGMRAVSVKVDEVIGVAGFVLPGTRVDVLVTVDGSVAATQTSITRVVLQNVQVMAAGESIETDLEGKPRSVTVITLLVTPTDAEKLTLAATEGHIQLALRNILDRDAVTTPGLDIQGLVRVQAPDAATRLARPAAAPAPASRLRVDVYRGVEKEVEVF